MTEPSQLRFVVGSFDSWPQLRSAMRDLHARGVVLDSFNCLALQQIFTHKTDLAPDQQLVDIEVLPFADETEVIACTAGPLADCLRSRIALGCQTLMGALNGWLIARHAAHFQDAVAAGEILFWIHVSDPHEERRAFQTLLAHSSKTVGVHDLVSSRAH